MNTIATIATLVTAVTARAERERLAALGLAGAALDLALDRLRSRVALQGGEGA